MGDVVRGWVPEPVPVRELDVWAAPVIQLPDGRLGMVTGVSEPAQDGTVTVSAVHGNNAPWTWPVPPDYVVQVLVQRDVLAGVVIAQE